MWKEHPVLKRGHSTSPVIGSTTFSDTTEEFGFLWKPIVTQENGLICALDILMLRKGPPGKSIYDIDNRLKTIFDALRKANSQESGEIAKGGERNSKDDETPFFVLLHDDSAITHVAITSDMLLDPVRDVKAENSVRLVIGVSIRPYDVRIDNLDFA